MISAFGIEHGYPVSKSLSGKTFKPITQMTGKQRGKILGSYKKLKGVSRSDKQWKKQHDEGKKIIGAHAEVAGSGIKHEPGAYPSALTFRTGGKKTGKSTVIGNAPTGSMKNYLQTHESAHADVKRSAYRLHGQILKNPEKTMREEARADYASGGHYTRHTAQGSTYARAARAQVKAEKQPNRPAKGSKNWFSGPRITNKEAYEGEKTHITAALPHYDLTGKKGDKAVRAYRDLHDSMRAKGVKEPTRKRPRLY